ncbi:Endo-1,4-beta-xylanase, GH35 family [Tangfeifania diversioriginum]|uniref:Beta-xylanase n=1 Tax=Tangfeifania diversioriginum TaxID=1168035 RepID=A0A1M6EPQ4_9BACT|nr:endo-1,4-beta-xylanase [Tangfeifania diversioriginum]SHI87423.1 Endo-1,4-beta-xylanase, GH35 family [Tangfeifania diversioriginum]
MKSFVDSVNGKYTFLFLIIVLSISFSLPATAQLDDLEKSIAEHRKGEIIIKAKPGAKIRVEQQEHEFWFGCAISDGIFNGRASENDLKMYKQIFLQNFNSAVTENAVKWPGMERRRGEVDYSLVDAMLEWTEENNIPLRAHNLFWGVERFIQPWIKELSNEELENTLKRRAETVTSRYKGRFAEYDLNNEMIHGNYYEDRLGTDITKKMALWAQNGDPDIKLYLNDYDILTGNMLDEYMAHIRGLLAQGVPIAGIGVQGHLHAESFDRGELKRSLDSLAQFNLPIKITEFNMPGQRSKYYQNRDLKMTAEEEKQKAKDLVDYYKICFAHPAVDGILMWGFWEGANWIPQSSLYKRDWTPTPAGEAYQFLIFDEWWTNVNAHGATNKDEISVPAFYGKYKITFEGETKEVELKKAEGKVEVNF